MVDFFLSAETSSTESSSTDFALCASVVGTKNHDRPYSEAPVCQISYSQTNNFHIYASFYFLFNIKKYTFNLIFHSFCVHTLGSFSNSGT